MSTQPLITEFGTLYTPPVEYPEGYYAHYDFSFLRPLFERKEPPIKPGTKQTTLDEDVVKVGPIVEIPTREKSTEHRKYASESIEERDARYGDHGEEVGSIQLSPDLTLSDFIRQFTEITAKPFTKMILKARNIIWYRNFYFRIFRMRQSFDSFGFGLQIYTSHSAFVAIDFWAEVEDHDMRRQIIEEMEPIESQKNKTPWFIPSKRMPLTASNLNSLREKFPIFFSYASDMTSEEKIGNLTFYYSPPEDLPFDETYPTIPGYITDRRMRGLVPDLKEGQQFHEEREDVREFIRKREVPRIKSEFPKMRFQPSIEESIEMADRKRPGDDIDERGLKRARAAAARLLQDHDIETAAQMLAQFQF
jgi:hypothetical protein